MICLLMVPLLWLLCQVLNQRGRGHVGGVGGGGSGAGAVRRGKRERGPTLEELLSGGGGQPKGRILVLESGSR